MVGGEATVHGLTRPGVNAAAGAEADEFATLNVL